MFEELLLGQMRVQSQQSKLTLSQSQQSKLNRIHGGIHCEDADIGASDDPVKILMMLMMMMMMTRMMRKKLTNSGDAD